MCTYARVGMYRHTHMCVHMLHPPSCAGWTEKATFQVMQGSRCPAVLGLYWGHTGAVLGLARVEAMGWVAGAGRSQSPPGSPALHRCAGAGEASGGRGRGGEERGGGGYACVFFPGSSSRDEVALSGN